MAHPQQQVALERLDIITRGLRSRYLPPALFLYSYKTDADNFTGPAMMCAIELLHNFEIW